MCACSVTQWCLTLCDPMDCSPPGSSVHGDSPGCHAILQGIYPTQEQNLSLLHWQADSLPPRHLGSPLTTPGFCKCFLMCFQELNSHGCTAKVHFIGRLLERQVYTTVSASLLHRLLIPQLQWKHSPKSQWPMLPKPVLHKACTPVALGISSILLPSLFVNFFLLLIS